MTRHRNLRTAGRKVAKFTEKAVDGLFRWLTTDRSIQNMAFLYK